MVLFFHMCKYTFFVKLKSKIKNKKMTFELIKNNAGYANNAAFIKKTFFFVLFCLSISQPGWDIEGAMRPEKFGNR